MVNHINVKENYRELLNFVKRENLLVVSKREAFDTIDPLLKLGHLYFAENRIFEAKEKWQDIKIVYPDLKLFYIGLIQTNKLDSVD